MDMWICLALIMLKCSVLHDIKSFIPDLSTTISQLSQVIPEVIHRNIHVERWQLLLGPLGTRQGCHYISRLTTPQKCSGIPGGCQDNSQALRY